MSIYGGKTWEGTFFAIDKVYNNYEEMLQDISNIFVGRYVLVRYCDLALPQDIRTELENLYGIDITNLEYEENSSEYNYFLNYSIDKNGNNYFTSADRKVFRAIHNGQNIIPQEIANLNSSITNEYIDSIVKYWKEISLSTQQLELLDFFKGTEENLNNMPIVNGRFYVTDNGNIYIDTNDNRIQLSTNIQEVNTLINNLRTELVTTIEEMYANNQQVIISETEPIVSESINLLPIWLKPSTNLIDYVVDQGIRDSWEYRLWSSGRVEMTQARELVLTQNNAITTFNGYIWHDTYLVYPKEFLNINNIDIKIKNININSGRANNSTWLISWQQTIENSDYMIFRTPAPQITEITNEQNDELNVIITYIVSTVGYIDGGMSLNGVV